MMTLRAIYTVLHAKIKLLIIGRLSTQYGWQITYRQTFSLELTSSFFILIGISQQWKNAISIAKFYSIRMKSYFYKGKNSGKTLKLFQKFYR
jgi:hypothetical protein